MNNSNWRTEGFQLQLKKMLSSSSFKLHIIKERFDETSTISHTSIFKSSRYVRFNLRASNAIDDRFIHTLFYHLKKFKNQHSTKFHFIYFLSVFCKYLEKNNNNSFEETEQYKLKVILINDIYWKIWLYDSHLLCTSD
jgi:hypothetical protein